MSDWLRKLLAMMGLRSSRPRPISAPPHDPARAARERQQEVREREQARIRLAALDVRVDVLTRRMRNHEAQKEHR